MAQKVCIAAWQWAWRSQLHGNWTSPTKSTTSESAKSPNHDWRNSQFVPWLWCHVFKIEEDFQGSTRCMFRKNAKLEVWQYILLRVPHPRSVYWERVTISSFRPGLRKCWKGSTSLSRNVWVHDISKRSYQIASRNKLQEFNQPETTSRHTSYIFLGKNGGSPLPRKGPFFWGTGTLLAEDTAMNNRERLNPGDPSGEVPPFIFNFQQTPLGFLMVCVCISTDSHSLAKGLFSCLNQNCWSRLQMPHWCFSRIFSNAFHFPAGKPAGRNIAAKTVQMAKWYIMTSDGFFCFKSILTVPKNTRILTRESRNISGKRKCQGDINRHVWAAKCFDLRRVLQIDSQPIPYVVHSSQPLKLTLPNLLVRTSPPIWKI